MPYRDRHLIDDQKAETEMNEQFLEFDMDAKIIATIKRHQGNVATMAREIVVQSKQVDEFIERVHQLESENETLKSSIETVSENCEKWSAEVGRLLPIEDYARDMQAELETLRTWAQDYKDMRRAYRHADSVGCAVEWLGENGDHWELLLSNILDRLIK